MINTNFSEKSILQDLKNTSNDIADVLTDNFDMYGIDFKNYDLITRLIKNTIKASIFRSLNGWTKKIDNTVTRRIEAMNDNYNGEQRKKILGIF